MTQNNQCSVNNVGQGFPQLVLNDMLVLYSLYFPPRQARGKKRQRGWFHSSHVKLLGPSSSKSSPSPLPGTLPFPDPLPTVIAHRGA